MGASEEKRNEMLVCKITDRVESFAFWVGIDTAVSLLTENGELKRAIRVESSGCNLVVGLKQWLRDRCKLDGYISWEPVGEDSPEASDRERIANFISELPDESFVEESSHIHQLYAWMGWKNNCISIAKCFLVGRGSPENPLLRALEEGQIDQYYHDQCWLSVHLYENLWKLLSLKEKRIRAAFRKQEWDFISPRIVLEQILANEINGEFSVVLKPRHEENAKELKKLAKLQNQSHKGFGLKEADEEERKRLVEKYSSQPKNIWLDRVLAIAATLAEKDALIRTHLEIHHAVIRGITKLELDAACKPHLKQHGQVSSTWRNGQKFSGLNHKWKG